MDNIITKGVLTLIGKRITGFTTEEFLESDPHDFSPAQFGIQTLVYVEEELIEELRQMEVPRCYYESGEIKEQTIVYGEFDTPSIDSTSDEYATYRIEIDEPMEFVITQATGHRAPNTSIYKKPIDGVIQFQVDSKIIGKVMVYGISDTHYTNEAELFVK